ncbi:hypothetical protein ACFFLM_24695 [Deinococcus oregonensis]|uniref:Uncharacterized protein n=1 Tax=Deinococcus oregonensis TaxID=1805970 RepID=A0ABV6B9Q5_9DEIO
MKLGLLLMALCLLTSALAGTGITSTLTGITLAPGATRLSAPATTGLHGYLTLLARDQKSRCTAHEVFDWNEETRAAMIGNALKTGFTSKKLTYKETDVDEDDTAVVREFLLTGTGVRFVGIWITDTGGSILAWCTLKSS